MATQDAGAVDTPFVVGVDVGGTFTDLVLVAGDAPPVVRKVPTTPDDQGQGVADGLAAAHPDGPVAHVAHGTTTATNAVLERDVARTVLVTTAGFADVLAIGRQDRPKLYDLAAVRPDHLVAREAVVTVDERVAHDGKIVRELTEAEVKRVADEVAGLAPEAVAISLLFSFVDPHHERLLADAIAARCDAAVTTSSQLVGELREYERASTVVLNAAVAPVMSRYLGRLQARVGEASIRVMTSGGGTAAVEVAAAKPVHTLLSGPAAGVVAASAVAASVGFEDAVAFDMGGTSTDVCLIRGGAPQVSAASEIGGLPFRTPAVAVHTVGAGGGSLAWVDAGGALRVGPRSAGARPGPACYGHGGTDATVTDAHAVLGHLDPGGTLGDGAVHLDLQAARTAVATVAQAARAQDPSQGILDVARATMVRALRRVTTEQGVDPARLALVAYGGAGPLHATALGRELGVRAVIIPPTPGVLSALGLLLAPPRAEAARTVMLRVPPDTESAPDPATARVWVELEEAATAAVAAQGGARDPRRSRVADCRYAGQAHELRVPADGDVVAAFHAAHAEVYGYRLPDEVVELVTARVIAEGRPTLDSLPDAWADPAPARPDAARPTGPDALPTRIVDRAGLGAGDRVTGPAVVEQPDATTLLGADDEAVVDDAGNLVVRLEDRA